MTSNKKNIKEFFNSLETDDSWIKKAKWRQENRVWLDQSSNIALKILMHLYDNELSKQEFANITGFEMGVVNLMVKGQYDFKLSEIATINEIIDGGDIKEELNVLDVKYLDIPNICFSLTDSDDKREPDFINQRIKRGFDDSETWSLKDTIAKFIVPRLERYQELAGEKLLRDDELIIDIEHFLDVMKMQEGDNIETLDELEYMDNGLKKLPKIWHSLWW